MKERKTCEVNSTRWWGEGKAIETEGKQKDGKYIKKKRKIEEGKTCLPNSIKFNTKVTQENSPREKEGKKGGSKTGKDKNWKRGKYSSTGLVNEAFV